MNKKFRTIAAGATVGILALTGCTEDTYSYEVSGTVEARQIDYDCPNEDVAMDAVAFVAGKGGTSGGGSRSGSGGSSGGSSGKSSGSTGKSGKGSGSTSTSGGTLGSSSTGKSTKTGSGVKLKKKPAKPEKIKGGKVPKPLYAKKPKGCETEYELYIRNDDGLFEQDVRREDYDNCTEGEKFAACTES